MSKKKQKVEEPEGQAVFITYMGRTSTTQHGYILGNFESELSFRKKLQRHHVIGETYPATRFGDSFQTNRIDERVENPDIKIDPNVLTEWVKDDINRARLLRARSEANKLKSAARQKAKELKGMYQRADHWGKIGMIRSFIEELEK